MAFTRAQAYHNLSVLLEAGVPVARSLRSAVAGARPALRRGFSTLAEGVSAGDALAETMAKHPKIFAPLDVLLVKVGEASGGLPESLRLLSKWYAFCDRLRRIVTSELVLPLIILHAAALIGPAPGVILGHVDLGGYVAQVVGVLAFLYVPAAAVLAVVRLTPRTGLARRLLDGLTLRMPLLGPGVRRLALSRYCRVFQALYKSGVPIVECAEMSAGVTGNAVVAGWLSRGADSARAGGAVSEGFSPELPKDFLDTWRIGEESGTLDEAAGRLADVTLDAAERVFVALGIWLPRLIYFLVCLHIVVRVITGYGMVMQLTR